MSGDAPTFDPFGFLLAGGRFSLAEWMDMDEAERRACIHAGAILLSTVAYRVAGLILASAGQEERALDELEEAAAP